MQISERIQNIRRSQAELLEELSLLEKLPAGLDINSMFRLHGQWHINLQGKLPDMLTTLPPSNAQMVLRDGSWIATPVREPLNWEQRVLALVQSRSGLSWFHYLSEGQCLAIKLENASLPDLPGYILDTTAHTTVLVRKPLDQVAPLASPEEQDQAEWDAFYAAEGYQERHKQFARVFHAASRRNREVAFDMLPSRPADTLEIAGEVLELRYAGTSAPSEVVPPHSELHALPRIGRFWQHFSEEQARRLVNFAISQRKDLEQLQTDAAKAGIQRVLSALANFESTYLQSPVADAFDETVLTRWVRQETGLPASVGLRASLYGSSSPARQISVQLWRFHESSNLTVASDVYDPAGFSFQNPSFYQYEENAGSF